MAKLRTRKVSATVGGVKGPEVNVELEPLGHGQRFRMIAMGVFTLIFIASLVQPRIIELGLFNKSFLDGEWWRIVTYAFLHGGWMHLIMNMLACYVFARVVEMHYGRTGMVAIFFVTGADEERGAELAPVLERNDDAGFAALRLRDLRLPHRPDGLAGLRSRMKRRAQVPVLMHEAERLLIVRVEVETARLETVGNGDPPDRAARLSKMIGDTDRLEHAHRAR